MVWKIAALNQEDVWTPIVVVIDKGAAGPHGLRQIVLPEGPRIMHKVNARFLCDLYKANGGVGDNRADMPSKADKMNVRANDPCQAANQDGPGQARDKPWALEDHFDAGPPAGFGARLTAYGARLLGRSRATERCS